MTNQCLLKLATALFVIFINVAPSSAQPLYESFHSLEYLLGNSPEVFIGTPNSVSKKTADDATLIELKFSIDETIKGIHQAKRMVTLDAGRTEKIIDQQIKDYNRFIDDKSQCLVLLFYRHDPAVPRQGEILDLSDQAELNVVTKELKFIKDPKTLVSTCRTHCKNDPGVLLTQGVRFALPVDFAQKHFSTPDVMLTLPVDPSLEKLAESFLDSKQVEVKWSAQRALKYFGRDTDKQDSKSKKQ